MLQKKTEEGYNAIIISLAYSCPCHLENPYCPVKEARKKNFSEKITWIKRLSLSTKQSIYQYHLLCSSKNRKKTEASLLPDAQKDLRPELDIVISNQS
ncbi:MAG: hypothetical protein D3910_24310, partial [Candidatus Electrothrix sp. ATG2]|nr:hypothetical protein [Candidatus Electrothrix sp. ATG2]